MDRLRAGRGRPARTHFLPRRRWLLWAALSGVGLAFGSRHSWAACQPTLPNPQGPFYLPGAPFTDVLCDRDEPGRSLVMTGTVHSAGDCRPLAGAVLDLWHANDQGMYYGLEAPQSEAPLKEHLLRGQVRCKREGAYSFRTILPGHYRFSRTRFRARHIHVTVSHAKHPSHTTQLYFPGDPHFDTDPLARRELLVKLDDGGKDWTGTFDFYLPVR